MTDPTISIATRDSRERVVQTVVDAFRDDPAFRYFFPGDYDRQSSAFAGLLFDTRIDHGSIWLADEGAAVAMWNPPAPTGREDDIAGGLGDVVGADALARIERYEAAVDHLLPQEPHWYLGILATDPAHAGRQLARTAMRHGLAAAAAAGVPASLETTNPGNVTRYQDAGWTISSEVDVDDLHVWIMVHRGVVAA